MITYFCAISNKSNDENEVVAVVRVCVCLMFASHTRHTLFMQVGKKDVYTLGLNKIGGL